MYGIHPQSTRSDSMEEYRDRKTAGSVVTYSVAAVVVMASVVAPAVMAGVVMGAVGMRYGGRVADAIRRQRDGGGGGVSPPDAPSPAG